MSTTKGQQLLGKRLGPYVLEQLLGHGGSSTVYLAQPQASEAEQKVAIKVFQPRSTLDAKMRKEFYKRFLREAESASKLHHPNILPTHSYNTQDGLPYIVMPYIPGGTLQDYVTQHGSLSLEEAQNYLTQAASALDYAHAHGCVHCDVKPANLLLDGEGHLLLSDFGIARTMQPADVSEQPDQLSQPDQVDNKPAKTVMGTPDYISPEQALGQSLDGRSDVYSLACTLFFFLTGHPPFKGNSTIAMALQHVHETPPLLGLLCADVTPGIDLVMRKALAKSPQDRFQSAGEFSTAFAAAVEFSAQNASTPRRLVTPRTVLPSSVNNQNGHAQGEVQVVVSKIKVREHTRRFQFFGMSRLLVAVVVLFVGIVGVALTTNLITSHGASIPPTSQPTVSVKTPTSIIPVDTLSDTQDWPTSQTTSSSFFFLNQQYHIRDASRQKVAQALYFGHQYDNFHLTITVSEIHGSRNSEDFYGVIFRSAGDQSHFYLFDVSAWSGGQYAFLRYDGNGQWKPLSIGSTPSLMLPKRKSNTLTIEASGNIFRFFVNGKAVGKSITDRSTGILVSGEIGLYVEQQGTEIVFSHLYINSLSL